jgi:hypothetical protein
MCHLQGASFILMSYLKIQDGCVVVMYCKCWWPVCTGCCSFVRRCAVIKEMLEIIFTSIYPGLNAFNFIRIHILQICVRKVAVYL